MYIQVGSSHIRVRRSIYVLITENHTNITQNQQQYYCYHVMFLYVSWPRANSFNPMTPFKRLFASTVRYNNNNRSIYKIQIKKKIFVRTLPTGGSYVDFYRVFGISRVCRRRTLMKTVRLKTTCEELAKISNS